MGAYFWWVIAFCVQNAVYFPVPFLCLFSIGFFYVGWMSLFQGVWQRLRPDFGPVRPAAAQR